MKKFAEIWDDIKKEKHKDEYDKENNENQDTLNNKYRFFPTIVTYTNMPSKKRTVKYSENTDPVDGDKNVEVSEEQSVNTEEQEQPQPQEESNTDERYNAASGN